MSAWLLIPAFIAGVYFGFALCALMVASKKPIDYDEGEELYGNPVARIDGWVRKR